MDDERPVVFSSRAALQAMTMFRPRICPGCQHCDYRIVPDDIERRMDQAMGLSDRRCDRGRIVYRDEPGFLITV